VRYHTDPGCPLSWSLEPIVRRLMVEFGGSLHWTYVMGGYARDFEGVYPGVLGHWLDIAERSGMPLDPRIWTEGPIASTYPACMAVKAASEQAGDGGYAYLRALREGLMCRRRKLDTTEALVEEARAVGLDVERFRLDLASNAIVEAFGNDLEATRNPPEGEPLPLPTLVFTDDDGGSRRVVSGVQPYDRFRDAAGVEPAGERPGVLDALRRFGRMATKEVEAVCGLTGPRAHAELWRLAQEWEVRPVPVLTGRLWELP
jgi:predicted DsbA family dithiol-disulfide isomerase